MWKWLNSVLVMCLLTYPAIAVAQADIGAFVRKDLFHDIKLSPNGDYYAATVPLEDRTGLAIMRRAEKKIVGSFSLGKNSHVTDFWWVNPERVVIAVAEKAGTLDEPVPTGELYAISADGSKPELLVGFRVQSAGPGTRLHSKKVENVAAFLVDALPQDDRHVIISVWPAGDEPYTRAERMDVYTGRRTLVARAPVRRADYFTDNQGVVRFAHGAGPDNVRKLYYRHGDGADWQLISDEVVDGNAEYPLGFSQDNRIAYLQVEQSSGPDAVIAYDVASGNREQIMRDEIADPDWIVYGIDSKGGAGATPVGVGLVAGKPRRNFFNPASAEAKLYGMLEAAFPGEAVRITSTTADGKIALVQVSSDRNPGDFYLFQIDARKAEYLLSRRDWFDPEKMAESRPIQLKARDGLPLHGYITLPQVGNGKNLPMVVLPHGGPFGVADTWGFDTEAQMLAQAGYAVLQVNFRGSGGYGRAFREAGAKQWGLKMQDDVTDATRWAIQSGVADPNRICIYGASYGAYAALAGVAKEPDLYRCAVGYAGVYDLPMMHTRGDIQTARSGEAYIREWIGERDEIAAVSPTNMANRIKVPIFLAAGGEDERTPIAHSELMERRLKAAGVPVETLYYKTEGHGFYTEEHRHEYYTKLLGFFGRHIGGVKSK
ncbi:alpha/beta hydrolase family protein [Pseudoxanthomonas sp. UTMC 1351]|uniref:alpha/beta hydrolase family protein n=1 Tax=Pseudoxanthomonas sp. UTMC 1351 TaxID=2695853 RepID=UPI0034CEC847